MVTLHWTCLCWPGKSSRLWNNHATADACNLSLSDGFEEATLRFLFCQFEWIRTFQQFNHQFSKNQTIFFPNFSGFFPNGISGSPGFSILTAGFSRYGAWHVLRAHWLGGAQWRKGSKIPKNPPIIMGVENGCISNMIVSFHLGWIST